MYAFYGPAVRQAVMASINTKKFAAPARLTSRADSVSCCSERAIQRAQTATQTRHVIAHELQKVEAALDTQSYRTGDWQRCLKTLDSLHPRDVPALKGALTRISNKRHSINGYPQAPAWVGFCLEYFALLSATLAVTTDGLLVRLAGVVLLALSLQPALKISTGVLLGVRYAYVYLWYFEPRFKMQFGSYLCLPRWRKLMLQTAGSLGTPIALLVGWRTTMDAPMVSSLLLAAAIIVTLMQIAAFTAVWVGFRKVGPFVLSNLTTPARLAQELQTKPVTQETE